MNTIALVACGKDKNPGKWRADELYKGIYFKKCLSYARACKPSKIFILSAKYGLLELDQEIETYDLYLPKLSVAKRREWGARVIAQLGQKTDLLNDKFLVLAGAPYREHLAKKIKHLEAPLASLGRIGYQMRWLTEKLDV